MVDPVFLSTFWDVIWATFVVFFVLMPLIFLWAFALIDLFMRRDIGWRKILWLVFIILIPVLGPLIYLLVRPDEYYASPYQEGVRDA